MRYIFAALIIFASLESYAECDYDKSVYPDITISDDLTCEEKKASIAWLKWAMYPPSEKAEHEDQWIGFISTNHEAASNLIREFLNYKDFDGAGDYEKWGILTSLPEGLRKAIIKKSYKIYAGGEYTPFSSFDDCWGILLIETAGLPEVVSNIEATLKYKTYNTELLKLAILHNYNMTPKEPYSKVSLLELYLRDYINEPDYYDYNSTSKELDIYLKTLKSINNISRDNIPFVFIP